MTTAIENRLGLWNDQVSGIQPQNGIDSDTSNVLKSNLEIGLGTVSEPPTLEPGHPCEILSTSSEPGELDELSEFDDYALLADIDLSFRQANLSNSRSKKEKMKSRGIKNNASKKRSFPSAYKISELENFARQQLRFTPEVKKLEQLGNAQKLFFELVGNKIYPYPYIIYRITGHRSDGHDQLMIKTEDLQNDLLLFIQELEESLPALPLEQALEPMLTLEEISKKFKVSTKTISRWKIRGLIPRRIIKGGRRHLAYNQSMIDQFFHRQKDRVERSSRFSHLTEKEKEEILRIAKNLVQTGGSLMEVSRVLAQRLGRSVEAVRYTIKNHDRANPQIALFRSQRDTLEPDCKEQIYFDYLKGTPVELLARKYGKSRNSVFRSLTEVRLKELLDQPLDYIHHDSFDDPTQEKSIMAPMPDEAEFWEEKHKMRAPKDVSPDLAALYEWPLLSREQEAHLFRKMNFLKYKLKQFQQKVDVTAARLVDLRKMEDYRRQIKEVRDRLINCNMRLVVKHAKLHSATEQLGDLISDGNVSLMRAIEKFNFSLGNKFSTYASWAIIKNYARSVPEEKTYRERFLTGTDELLNMRLDSHLDEAENLTQNEMTKQFVSELLKDLDPRTREVIRMRNGLDGCQEMTLEQIGLHFGITKERVRQINVRGMKQLRDKAAQGAIQLP